MMKVTEFLTLQGEPESYRQNVTDASSKHKKIEARGSLEEGNRTRSGGGMGSARGGVLGHLN